MKVQKLFTPGSIGSMNIKNRVVLPPMVRNYSTEAGLVTPRYVAHVRRIAQGGVGMMILEASYVRSDGRGFVRQLAVDNDACVPGLRKLASVAHQEGAVIGIQLFHAGRQTSMRITGQTVIAPSALPDPTTGGMPVAMSEADISEIVAAFGRAARRAKDAGLDFVEVHGAHGYLLTQFLSSFSNRRTDKYGGSLVNRMRLLREVVAAVRKEVGADFPIIVRLSGYEMVDGGLTPEETAVIAKQLEADGVDALHVSAGNYASYARGYMIPPMAMPDGPLTQLAAGVKQSVSIPVIAVGKIRSPLMAERLLTDGTVDFVAVGRTLLADPEWPKKAQSGGGDTINPCIACNQGCIQRLFAQEDVWCTVNPETGREEQFARKPAKKLRIVVAGGGPAGLSAARTAAQRGHRVTLIEKSRRLGGQLHAAAAAPNRQGWFELRWALLRDIKRLGVDVRLGEAFDAKTAAKFKPDVVVLAVGSSAAKPKIPGVGRTHVTTSRDLLEGKTQARGRVVLVGGGCAGAQTAEFVAAKGLDVTLIEASGEVALDAPVDDRALLLGRLEKLGVTILTHTRVMSVGPQRVSVESHSGARRLPADTVVLCLGSRPNDAMAEELKKTVPHVVTVGDAAEPRRVTEAMAEGALAVIHAE